MAQTAYLYTDERFYQTLLDLSGRKDWAVIRETLEHSLQAIHESMEWEQSELRVRWKQGVTQFIREWLECEKAAHNRCG